MALRREAFEGAGGFDEDYWYGGEDVDLSFAVRAAGWRLASVADSRVPVTDGTTGGTAPWSPSPWSAVDPQQVSFAQSIGPTWQQRDNLRRFVQKWRRVGDGRGGRTDRQLLRARSGARLPPQP